jgi:hypothetical protein
MTFFARTQAPGQTFCENPCKCLLAHEKRVKFKPLVHDPPTGLGGQKGVALAGTSRRRRGQDTWHFCSNCSNWPTRDYDERVSPPTTGEYCNECRSKRANGICR